MRIERAPQDEAMTWHGGVAKCQDGSLAGRAHRQTALSGSREPTPPVSERRPAIRHLGAPPPVALASRNPRLIRRFHRHKGVRTLAAAKAGIRAPARNRSLGSALTQAVTAGVCIAPPLRVDSVQKEAIKGRGGRPRSQLGIAAYLSSERSGATRRTSSPSTLFFDGALLFSLSINTTCTIRAFAVHCRGRGPRYF